MTKTVRPLSLLAGLALGLLARADTTLAPSSPFAPPDGASVSAADNQPLELRGIMMDGGGYRFSVYDPAKKSGQWVRLNESGHDFKVRTHDVARDTITLDFQGRVLTLPLRASKVVGVAVTEPATGPRPTVFPSGVGPMPQPGTPEEKARFNRAVEEIKRRRDLREKGPVPVPNTNKVTSPGPVPRPQ